MCVLVIDEPLSLLYSGSLRYGGGGYHVPVSRNQLTEDRRDHRQEKVEGRNFILDKLCELGFGEVTCGFIVFGLWLVSVELR